MHLEKFTIENFRKFREHDNTVHFVNSTAIKPSGADEDVPLMAPSSTLIIGKNNAGKTTIAHALNFICSKSQPKASDFNIEYLRDLIAEYKAALENGASFDDLPTPCLKFVIEVKVNLANHEGDLVNNLYQFVPISSDSSDLVEIIVKYQVKEAQAFKDSIHAILNNRNAEVDEKKLISVIQFEKFFELLNNEDSNVFNIVYLNSSNKEVKDPALKRLFNLKLIKANRHLNDGVLSEMYRKIVSSQYVNNEKDKESLKSSISKINKEIDAAVGKKSTSISSILKEVEQSNHVGVGLSGNVTESTVLKNLIKYSFSEGDDYIPEDQFGLGYINLLNIIGEIIHYIDSYEDKSHRNQINLLFIEEPEAFMHPQMQEFFITRIDKAVKKALVLANSNGKGKPKSLHCQLVITTHSSHIVNSKIHSSNSFNNINYLNSFKRCAEIVNLDDALVAGDDSLVGSKALEFIKKHIKYKVSELFFSDAVIFVEGVTEETMLHFYLDKNSILKNYYISIFNINGAHGKLYYPLAKALKIPCLIITDIDIKRSPCEKGETNKDHKEDEVCTHCGKDAGVENFKIYSQLTSLVDRFTTNETIKNFNQVLHEKSGDDVSKIDSAEYFEDENLYVIFQKNPVEQQYATSFEEAFILTNYKNKILNSVLEYCKPQIYKEIVGVGDSHDKSKLISNSFKLQRKLSDSKSEFSNSLLYECITSDRNEVPDIPNYINDGFLWLGNKLVPQTEKREVANVNGQ